MEVATAAQFCPLCSRSSVAFVYEPTTLSVFPYPDKAAIHVHYSSGVFDNSACVNEARWSLNIAKKIYSQYPKKKFFILVDVSDLTYKQFFTTEAIRYYVELGNHPQSDMFVYYGLHGFKESLVKLIFHYARTKKKIILVDDYEAADKEYAAWRKKHST